jgi:hypothetical protein
MSILLSLLLVVAVVILGWVVLPILGFLVIMPTQLVVSFVNRFAGYLVARYTGLIVDIVVLVWFINWAGEKFQITTWPAWIVGIIAIGSMVATVVGFDVRCYQNGTGAWAFRRNSEDAREASIR